MKRVPMLKRGELAKPKLPELTLRPSLMGPNHGFLVSVVGGPYDLLWRETEELALADGMKYLRRCYPKLFF